MLSLTEKDRFKELLSNRIGKSRRNERMKRTEQNTGYLRQTYQVPLPVLGLTCPSYHRNLSCIKCDQVQKRRSDRDRKYRFQRMQCSHNVRVLCYTHNAKNVSIQLKGQRYRRTCNAMHVSYLHNGLALVGSLVRDWGSWVSECLIGCACSWFGGRVE